MDGHIMVGNSKPIKIIFQDRYKISVDENNIMNINRKDIAANIFPNAKNIYKTDKELIIEYFDGSYQIFEKADK